MTVIDTNSNCIDSIDTLRARGVTAVGRYYRVVHPEWRLTATEAQKLSAAGIKLFTVYEDVGHNLTLTAAQGKIDGQNALDQATEVGQPAGTPIYFALEGLPNGYVNSDLPAIRKYFTGVRQAIGTKYQLGVYSNGLVCETLLDEGVCAYTWLSASKAFAGTRDFYRSGRWNLAQTTPLDQNWNGLSVDVDEAKGDFGEFAVTMAPAVAEAIQGGGEMGNFYVDVIMNDPRFNSSKRIADPELLEPVTRDLVQAIIADAAANGLKLMIFETYRSSARQIALFNQGATKLKQVGVHHYGLACDIVKDINGQPSWKGDFSMLGALAKHHKLIWGGDWGTRAVFTPSSIPTTCSGQRSAGRPACSTATGIRTRITTRTRS
jgi:glycoside hydrolase-like protein